MFAHLDELYASNKDLMDEVCPTFMDHVGAWAEAAESGALVPTIEPAGSASEASGGSAAVASASASATVSASAEGASLDSARDVVEELTNAVFGFSIETKSESVKTMKELLQEVRASCDCYMPS